MAILGRVEFWTIVGYVAVIVAVAAYFSRRVRGGTDYFAGGRRVPWWLSGVSLYMGNFSAWMFTGGAGLIYRTTGYGLLYFFLITTFAYIVGSRMTAALWRRSRVISPIEFTQLRFGGVTRLLLATIFAVMYLAAAGSQLLALARIVHGSLDVPTVAAAVVVGVLVMTYTLAGGVWTVVVTDFVQFVILLAVVLVVAVLATGLVDGGIGTVVEQIDFTIPPPDGDPDHTLAFLVAGALSFTLGAASVGSPRYYCCPNESDARRAGLCAGLLFLTTPILFAVPALVGREHFGDPATLATLGWGENPHELVFLRVVDDVFSPGLVGLFVAAMFAASMSALDSVNNVVAAVLSRDVWMHGRPGDERSVLRTGRVMTFVCGAVVTVLAVVYLYGPSDLFTIMTTVAFYSAPPLYVPIVLGMFWRKAPPGAGWVTAAWALAWGAGVDLGLGWGKGSQAVTATLTSAVVFFASPLFLRGDGRSRMELWERLDRPVDVVAEVGDTATTTRELLRLIGALTLVMAALVAVLFVVESLIGTAAIGAYGGIVGVMTVFGVACRRGGRASEAR